MRYQLELTEPVGPVGDVYLALESRSGHKCNLLAFPSLYQAQEGAFLARPTCQANTWIHLL